VRIVYHIDGGEEEEEAPKSISIPRKKKEAYKSVTNPFTPKECRRPGHENTRPFLYLI
jgi:hypothetical protein